MLVSDLKDRREICVHSAPEKVDSKNYFPGSFR
jgi:hypothetical protein